MLAKSLSETGYSQIKEENCLLKYSLLLDQPSFSNETLRFVNRRSQNCQLTLSKIFRFLNNHVTTYDFVAVRICRILEYSSKLQLNFGGRFSFSTRLNWANAARKNRTSPDNLRRRIKVSEKTDLIYGIRMSRCGFYDFVVVKSS